jgi:hypothetical protein
MILRDYLDCGESFVVIANAKRCIRCRKLCVLCKARPKAIPTQTRGRCEECAGVHVGAVGALVDGTTRYGDDVAAQLFVGTFPRGASHALIGDAMGLTRARIQQVEAIALRKLARRLPLVGVEPDDVLHYLANRERAA